MKSQDFDTGISCKTSRIELERSQDENVIANAVRKLRTKMIHNGHAESYQSKNDSDRFNSNVASSSALKQSNNFNQSPRCKGSITDQFRPKSSFNSLMSSFSKKSLKASVSSRNFSKTRGKSSKKTKYLDSIVKKFKPNEYTCNGSPQSRQSVPRFLQSNRKMLSRSYLTNCQDSDKLNKENCSGNISS